MTYWMVSFGLTLFGVVRAVRIGRSFLLVGVRVLGPHGPGGT
jgi:hypothetical protein